MVSSSYQSIKQVNIAILGGGLAGLALAAELSAPEFSHLSVIVIEQRDEYIRDKTWSYWRQIPHDFSDCESATWPAWRVQDAKNSVTVDSAKAENYVYASIASDEFYEAVLAKIAACSHVELLQNERVQSIRTESGRAIVTLKSACNIVVNQFIFDARPPEQSSKQHLYQHFLGLEMEADKAVFDASCVDLMDFQPSHHGIHFMYVLPYSATHALIESTWICTHQDHTNHLDLANRAGYAHELNDYLLKRWPNAQFNIAYTESASQPLIAHKARKQWLGQTQLIPIGTPAGTARAATGYAFLDILQDAKRLANLIKTNQPLTTFKRNKIDAWIDALFLSFLYQNAQFGAKLFVQLFNNCAPASLIRFLTGQANWRDRLAVIRAMPAKPILKHLFRFNSST
jgi:lycopene beta-cyclase